MQELFSTQLEFNRHGTAELYDLARTWLAWRDLHSAASSSAGLVTSSQSTERTQALRTLEDLAERSSDRRGRIAADVAFVQLLAGLDAVDSARATSGATRGYLQ